MVGSWVMVYRLHGGWDVVGGGVGCRDVGVGIGDAFGIWRLEGVGRLVEELDVHRGWIGEI